MSRLARWSFNTAYLLAIALASPLIAWSAWRKGKYREGYDAKLLGRVPKRDGDRRCVWLHAVSVGEVNLLGVLIAELRHRHPDWDLCVSTTTKTGYDLAQKKYGPDHTVFYCPLDFSWAVAEAVRRVRPDLLLLAELELWPNLIDAAKRHGARVGIVNGRLSENSFRGYSRIRSLVHRTLRQIDLVAVQDIATRERFVALGASRRSTDVPGSLKYDGAETRRGNPRTTELRELAGFDAADTVWLAGSTQAPEEAICLRVFKEVAETNPHLRLVLVPRHPERFAEVSRLLDQSGLDWQRRTQLTPTPPVTSSPGPSPSVLLVDSVGELGAWWGTAQIGFVGGSFGDRGGQNMIEPAAYGVATCFGPNTRNFRDIVTALLRADGARVVADEAALEAFVSACLAMPVEAQTLGDRARRFVATQLGATRRTADAIDKLMGVPASIERQRRAA
ncbi:3-deoxy-D-manno-octulosonic acid transferase [Botrimarina colliarenosi]|uniref:3-deoxy-D-manno-octulosonic acid transferase n=1 Tax=Botrimarina colliarenosi TaxID=2528001 RepID=A0A5C6ADC2_9BACT|nr:3-deoxy-D-manno-octulosonic acid transferase [Botrimarina colliarenosi]TWT97061.1 3-deoxy-D-manno-octulosonic acid transferase [Botrimarina colliarenosi]